MPIKAVIFWMFIFLSSVASAGEKSTIAFHKITDEIDSVAYRHDLELSELTFEEEPWLTDADIVTWDGSTGWIFLTGDKEQFLGKFDSSFSEKKFFSSHFKLFVVVVNGEPCFVGEFHSAVSSVMPRYPSINDIDLLKGPSNAIKIRSRTWDPKLIEALQDLGLYRAGLKVMLTGARIKNSEDFSKARLEYDIMLMNCDRGDLMILDPSLMSPDFEGYRAWFFARRVGTDRDQVSEQMRRPGGFNEFDPSWLVKVPAKGTLSCTLSRETEHLDPGAYTCFLIYPGPRNTADADTEFGDARIWYGQVKSNEIEVKVE